MCAALPTRDGHGRRRLGVPPAVKLSAVKLSALRMQRCRRATPQYAEEISAH
ncbi:MAG: hypothetical protein ACYDDU_05925 [Dermatophilaceae bacterium]